MGVLQKDFCKAKTHSLIIDAEECKKGDTETHNMLMFTSHVDSTKTTNIPCCIMTNDDQLEFRECSLKTNEYNVCKTNGTCKTIATDDTKCQQNTDKKTCETYPDKCKWITECFTKTFKS